MEALRDDAECLFLAGNGADPETRAKPELIAGIGYDGMRSDQSPFAVAEEVLAAITAKWPSGCDILHVHNPVLNKNRDFLAVLRILAGKGVRLFLQVHDAAEDLRPHSYYRDEEYPENCHYGVINTRDYRLFLDAGLRPEGLHRVFNVVQPLPRSERTEAKSSRKLLLYAVRAIRRKNLGEAMLLSCFIPRGFRVGLTLPPTSPADYPSYEEWKSFAVQERLSVDFELGLGRPLDELVSRSALMITTSVREGFGFSFLEPWTADRAVVGRRLDAVAPDFEAAGVDLSTLYSRIRCPLDLFDAGRLRTVWIRTVETLCAEFGRETPFDPRSAWESLAAGGCVDFAYLDAEAARGITAECRRSEVVRARLSAVNPFLDALTEPMNDADLIGRNRDAVRKNYSLAAYRKTLLDVYEKVAGRDVAQRIDKKRLLGSFLTPENFLLGGM